MRKPWKLSNFESADYGTPYPFPADFRPTFPMGQDISPRPSPCPEPSPCPAPPPFPGPSPCPEEDSCCGCMPGPAPCPPEPEPEPPCVICPEPAKEYAFFSQNGRLYNSALFGGIRLENTPVQTSGFYYEAGVIHIVNAGFYLITYIVNFPDSGIVNTMLALQMNNENVPGTTRAVSKNAISIPYTATAQTIVQVDTMSAVRLSSSEVINFMTPQANTVASLSLIRL